MSAPSPMSVLSYQPAVAPAVRTLTCDLLAWVAGCLRSYAEVMEAWRSSCPRFTIWEDGLGDGLVRLERGGSQDEWVVALTVAGRTMLDAGTA